MIKRLFLCLILFASCGTSSDDSKEIIFNNNGYTITKDTLIDTTTGVKTEYNVITKKSNNEYISAIDTSIKFSLIKIFADENLNNYLQFDLENLTDKIITTIALKQGSEITNIQINLNPKTHKTFKVSTKLKTDFEVVLKTDANMFGIQKIRFKDGTFLTR